MLGSFWNHFGTFGIVLELFRDRVGIVVGSFWNRFGIISYVGIIWGLFGDNFGDPLYPPPCPQGTKWSVRMSIVGFWIL